MRYLAPNLLMGSTVNRHSLGLKRGCTMVCVSCVECYELHWIERTKYRAGQCIRCFSCSGKLLGRYVKAHRKGRYVNSTGYVMVYLAPDDPYISMASERKSWVIPEHRHIMAQHLGRCLESDEIVHHLNSVRDDNRIENLQLTTNSEHASKYMRSYRDGYDEGYKAGFIARGASFDI